MSDFLLELIVDFLTKTAVGIAVRFAVDALTKIKIKRRPSNKE